jgi:tetratricopeptide (TPR) repeat protein
MHQQRPALRRRRVITLGHAGQICRAIPHEHRDRIAIEADPKLELTGSHSLVILLRDLGRLEEAEALGRRCLEARRGWGDLSALCMADLQLGQVYTELGQMEKAEECLLEAQRVSQKLAGNPAITLSAICYRAIMEFNRGNPANFRKYAEEAYGLAQGRYRCLQAYCGQVLAGALTAWG